MTAAPRAGPSSDSSRSSGRSSTEARISHIKSLRAMPPETVIRVMCWPDRSCSSTPRAIRNASASSDARNRVPRSVGCLGDHESPGAVVSLSDGSERRNGMNQTAVAAGFHASPAFFQRLPIGPRTDDLIEELGAVVVAAHPEIRVPSSTASGRASCLPTRARSAADRRTKN